MTIIVQTPQQTLSLGEQLETRRLEHRAVRLRVALGRLRLLSAGAEERGETVAPRLRAAAQGFRHDLESIEARLELLRR